MLTSSKTLQLAFVGTGWIGRHRMQALLHHGAQASVIVEPDADASAAAQVMALGAVTAATLSDAVAHPLLDGVVLATPSALHAHQAITALAAGKAVFCQKPLGRNAAEVARVIAQARMANRLLGLDLSYRHTCYRLIYDLVQQGELGEVYAVEAVFHNAYGPGKAWFFDPAQSGGGCLVDLGVHLADLALWTLGFPAATVQSVNLLHKGRPAQADQCEDYASALIRTPAGASIQLTCSWNLPAGQEADIQVNVYGTKGGAAFRNLNGSFYDFGAYRFYGTQTEVLFEGKDDWGGRAAIAWMEQLAHNPAFDPAAWEFLTSAELLDEIYAAAVN